MASCSPWWRWPPACSGSPRRRRLARRSERCWPAEEEYLTANWTLWKVLIALLVPVSFAALGLAFWKRSLVWGLAIINGAILFKIGWTFVFSTEAGAMSHLPAAVLGLAVCDAVILYLLHRMRRRSSEPSRPADHHG